MLQKQVPMAQEAALVSDKTFESNFEKISVVSALVTKEFKKHAPKAIGTLKKVYVRGTTPSILHLYALTGWGPNFRGLCSRTLSRPLWWYFAFF